MKPHKHAELIKAWADGAEIEYFGSDCKWHDAEARDFDSELSLRIKPESKPDVEEFWHVSKEFNYMRATHRHQCNIKLTFDGETGELKSAEVLK